jgi:steroid delta-isomerase-like uncharacterized protein
MPMGNEEIARAYLETWNRRDWTAFEALVAEDATIVDFDGSSGTGPAGARAQGELYATAFPDGVVEIVRLIGAGDVVVAELIGRGTNDGPFGDTPPTHRKAELPFVNVITIRDGKVAGDRQYGDTMTLLAQLGLVPEPAHA